MNIYKCFMVIILTISFKNTYSQVPTFNKDIAPIIYKHCLSCHQEGKSGPFPLVSYKDVASKSKIIAEVVKRKYMPPWKADPKFSHFDNENYLEDHEISLITKWAANKSPQGAGSPPVLKTLDTLYNKKPDAVIKMPTKYRIKGNNNESFVWMKVPYEIQSSKKQLHIEKLEFVAGNKKLLHHVNYEILRVASGLEIFNEPYYLEAKDSSKEEFSAYEYFGIFPYQSYFKGGWLPGQNPQIYSDDIGIVIPRKGVIFFNKNHYAASPLDETDSSYINVYFKREPLEREVKMIAIGSGAESSVITPPLIIPADSIKTFTVTSVLENDISVLYLTPHMHLLGKTFVAHAILPEGDTIPLIKINDWDFNWQLMYKLNPYLKLPKGTTILIKATFDNTINNPKNPFNPARTSYSTNGMKTTDEMLQLGLFTVPYKEGDEEKYQRE